MSFDNDQSTKADHTQADTKVLTAKNRQQIIDYFESGSKDNGEVLGVEVEHFVVMKDGTPVAYYEHGLGICTAAILEYMQGQYPIVFQNSEGEVIGCASDEASITLEPAAQLEISIAPFSSVEEIGQAYQNFRDFIDPYLEDKGAMLVSAGYHPSRKAEELPLIPKERYRLMDEYFTKLGTKGLYMMRASASTQVSIDYSSEPDAVRKMRIGSALAPILGAIADNAEFFEGQPCEKPLVRLAVWRNVDNARCGVVPGVFEPSFGFRAYADWLLRTSPIFINETDDKGNTHEKAVGALPASEAYSDRAMQKEDIEHLISMFWPDVRLKRFVEIRPADSLPARYLTGYAALIKGLFYSEENRIAIEEKLNVTYNSDGIAQWPLTEDDVDQAISDIRDEGFEAKLYGFPLKQWINFLFDIAYKGLDDKEASYLDDLKQFAFEKKWGRKSN